MITAVVPVRRKRRRLSIGMIGVGALGAFAVKHLAADFRVVGFDPVADLSPLEERYGLHAAPLRDAARCDIVVLSMPVQMLEKVVREITPHLRKGSVVLDVCSVKTEPAAILARLPSHVQVVGTHPLFGPQSGKAGIEGLSIAIIPIRGTVWRIVAAFLRNRLKLKVAVTTAEDHDRQMAYVQGLTHLMSRIVLSLPAPNLTLTTTAFDHLRAMVDLLRRDSDELFRAICTQNPYMYDVIRDFLDGTSKVGAQFGESDTQSEGRASANIRMISDVARR